MKKNTVRLTESQLHRVIKESVNNILKEYIFPDTEEKIKSNEMDDMWYNYGNVNRLDDYSTRYFEEPLAISAQHGHDSFVRSGARGFRNGTRASADDATKRYMDKHPNNFRWK